MLSIVDALTNDSFSTAFSGVEAAGCAVNCLRSAWEAKTGCEFPGKVSAAAYQIEWNRDCVAELLPHAIENGTCLFRNIAMFYRPELKETIDRLLQAPHMAVEILAPLIASKRAMRLEAHCETHNRICSLKTARRAARGRAKVPALALRTLKSCTPWRGWGSASCWRMQR